MFFLPWWLLLVSLVVSAFLAYFLLERTQAGDSPWALYPLTAVLAPVVLAVLVFAAMGLSTILYALLEDRSALAPEGTGTETTLVERAIPFTMSTPPSVPSTATPSAPSTASPTASPSASPSASPTASPSASPSP